MGVLRGFWGKRRKIHIWAERQKWELVINSLEREGEGGRQRGRKGRRILFGRLLTFRPMIHTCVCPFRHAHAHAHTYTCTHACVLVNQFVFELAQVGLCTCKQRLEQWPFKICFSSRADLQKKSKEADLTTEGTVGSVWGLLSKEEMWISCSLIWADTQAHTLYRISPMANKPFNHGKKTRRFCKRAFAVPTFGVPDPVFLPDCERHLLLFKQLSDQYLINCLLIFGSAE